MRKCSGLGYRVSLLAGVLVLAAGCQRPAAFSSPRIDTLHRLDPATATKDAKSPVLWYDARNLTVEGKGWTDTDAFFERLPTKAKGFVTDAVWGLSKQAAGLCVRFITDAGRISARWTVTSPRLAMDHMPASGVSGLDLYVNDRGIWRWTGVGRLRGTTVTNECVLAEGIPAGPHEYMLYLPLYNGVKSLEIGVNPEATLAHPAPRPAACAKPIVVYGTSITQGGCASRPGMAHVAILGRKLGRPMINLGFSGSGKMEPSMAAMLAELDASVYVLDCLPNMTGEMVTERVEPFVEALRKTRPDTPIVLVECVMYEGGRFLPEVCKRITERNEALRIAYSHLIAKGVRKLTYVSGGALLGTDGEGTVDGTHPTDLGFMRFADALEPVLRTVLGS